MHTVRQEFDRRLQDLHEQLGFTVDERMQGAAAQGQGSRILDRSEPDEAFVASQSGHLSEGGTGQDLTQHLPFLVDDIELAGDEDEHVDPLVAGFPYYFVLCEGSALA